MLRLKGGVVKQVNMLTVSVQVSSDDLSELKVDRSIATSEAQSFVRLLAAAVVDPSNNANLEMSAGRQVDEFQNDSVDPVLDGFASR